MQARTLVLAAGLAGLLGVAVWWLPSGGGGPPHPVAVDPVATVPTVVPTVSAGELELGDTFPIEAATTPAEVREVLRLTNEASATDRRALRDAALHSSDPLVAGNAARALGRLGYFTSDPALLALIEDPRPRVRQDAVAACGLDGDPAAIPHLEHALATGGASLRPLVIRSLGQIGGPVARQLVDRVAADPDATNTDRVFARAAFDTR